MYKIAGIEFDEFPVLLAPMENVTGPSFRIICKPYGPDIMYSEFVSSEGLIREIKKTTSKLKIYEEERPVAIQIVGKNVEAMRGATEVAERYNPDFIDINFGCSVRRIVKRGSGAALLNDIPKMMEMTKAVVNATKLPVTVKTRLGWDEDNKNIVDIAEQLQDIGVQAITIHGRTRAQIYTGKADYTLIGAVKNNPRMHIPIIGNGDITSPEIAKTIKDTYGLDGVMIGRASIGNPWIFKEIKHYLRTGEKLPPISFNERVDVCKKHLDLTIDMKNERAAIYCLRRHYHNYFSGTPHFKEYRLKLYTLESRDELFELLDEIKVKFG